jgi:hypothetical protein
MYTIRIIGPDIDSSIAIRDEQDIDIAKLHMEKLRRSLAQPQAEQRTCQCAKTCLRANGGETLNLDGSPKVCKGLPGDGREIRFPRNS